MKEAFSERHPVLTRGQKGAFTKAWNKYRKNMGVISSVRQLEFLYANFRYGYYIKHKLFCDEEMKLIYKQQRKRRATLMKMYYDGILKPDLITNNKSNEQPTS